MRIRHKVPSIFSLSMVDVLCCSLGCVILLWLLNARQNDEETEEHRKQTEEHRQQLLSEHEKAMGLQARLEEQIRSLQDARTDLQTRLGEERGTASALETKLKSSAARLGDLEQDLRIRTTRLAEERKRAGSVESKLAGTEKLLAQMRSDLDRARARYRSEERRADGLQKVIDERQRELGALDHSLDDAKAARSKLEKTLLDRDKELAAARVYKDRWEAAEERERSLAKQLKDRQAAMAVAAQTLEKLEKRHQREAESRFAGIALTGRRVIFLVDKSGSMELVDEETPAPHKWVEVRNTVARLMRSLPDLEKYQVITFSSKPEFPLGSAQKWLDHDPKSSPEKVLKTLAAIKPKDGTNMYAALEAAFRYRADGLDTVYLLSDGLPNQGEGLTPAQARDLDEIARGAILGKYVRATLKSGWNKGRSNRPRVRINTIGFFYESPDLGAFLWALAQARTMGVSSA